MVRILFLDTSALMSFFISDKGTPTMRWLISSDNKAHNTTRYVINNQVISEFEGNLKELVRKNDIKQTTADNILDLFNTHYKSCKFKIVGKNATIKDTMDGMYNFMGRLSRPILVTSNTTQISNNKDYKIINPQSQTTNNIALILKGKENRKEEKESNLYRRIFTRTRMAMSL